VSTTVITVKDKVETVIGQASETSSRNRAARDKEFRADDWDTGNLENSAQNAKKPRDLAVPRRLPIESRKELPLDQLPRHALAKNMRGPEGGTTCFG
jgi:hypothetical protein